MSPEKLAAGDSSALFKLFVLLAMYQARRDVVLEKQQRGMSRSVVQVSLANRSPHANRLHVVTPEQIGRRGFRNRGNRGSTRGGLEADRPALPDSLPLRSRRV